MGIAFKALTLYPGCLEKNHCVIELQTELEYHFYLKEVMGKLCLLKLGYLADSFPTWTKWASHFKDSNKVFITNEWIGVFNNS